MRNIKGRMDDVTLENGRRKIARECRDKLKQLKKLSDKQSAAILKDYLPKFQLTLSEKHKKFPPIMWLTYYVNSIDKEINSGWLSLYNKRIRTDDPAVIFNGIPQPC
ncbi:hypothetical protein RMN62_10585 [Providencia stuartii]|nr:hypothetical protein [Providencia stuartii]